MSCPVKPRFFLFLGVGGAVRGPVEIIGYDALSLQGFAVQVGLPPRASPLLQGFLSQLHSSLTSNLRRAQTRPRVDRRAFGPINSRPAPGPVCLAVCVTVCADFLGWGGHGLALNPRPLGFPGW